MGFEVVVLGSLNYDVSVRTGRLPRPGETVLGTEHFFGHGGKGANQAYGAARLGANVAMIGRVGNDANGDSIRGSLADIGVDVSGVTVDEEIATGLAVIVIDDDAENTIVVSPGANSTLTPAEVESHATLLGEADVVVAQLEVPIDAVLKAAQLTRGRFLLNPAPALDIPSELLELTDVLVPNRSELAAIVSSDLEATTLEDVKSQVSRLETRAAVVVTLGSDGALVSADGVVTHVPPFEVEPVDPTGAGDAFCAALAVGLARGQDLEQVARQAAAAGALAATASGAQAAMPSADAVEALILG